MMIDRAKNPISVLEANTDGDATQALMDRHGRTITDLRVSVTDRCNYKCVYCRSANPESQYAELPMAAYLRMIESFVELGINKVRVTGGEPLLYPAIIPLIERLGCLRNPKGEKLDLALTTNGHLLHTEARRLRDAGLSRLTVSMDAMNRDTVARITRVNSSYDRILAGIGAAKEAGFERIKVNCVLLRGFNDDQIVAFARFSREMGVIVRFIEFMPLDESRVWAPETVVPFQEVVSRLEAFRPLVALPATAVGETAVRYTFDDGIGEIGIIAPVSRAFCGQCSRLRLTSDGKIRTCLFSQSEHDLFGLMKRGADQRDVEAYIRQVVNTKEARHHIGEAEFLKPSRNMVQIGG